MIEQLVVESTSNRICTAVAVAAVAGAAAAVWMVILPCSRVVSGDRAAMKSCRMSVSRGPWSWRTCTATR